MVNNTIPKHYQKIKPVLDSLEIGKCYTAVYIKKLIIKKITIYPHLVKNIWIVLEDFLTEHPRTFHNPPMYEINVEEYQSAFGKLPNNNKGE